MDQLSKDAKKAREMGISYGQYMACKEDQKTLNRLRRDARETQMDDARQNGPVVRIGKDGTEIETVPVAEQGTKPCLDCGKRIPSSGNHKRCPECAKRAHDLWMVDYRKRKREDRKNNPRLCKDCGKPMEPLQRNRCKDCRWKFTAEKNRIRARERARERAATQKEEAKHARD